ncbi:hypothetical protein LTR85_003126 [Meristemomyces frigidus]|nr:hypothetical protein LTR85_003126 [Meristemomyces frigidus]
MVSDKALAQLLSGLNIATLEKPRAEDASQRSDAPNNTTNAIHESTRVARRRPHHETVVEYPVKTLVPLGAELFLLEPNDVEYRDPPKATLFNSSRHTLDYRLAVDLEAYPMPYVAKQHTVGRLVGIIDQVSHQSGRTYLSAISFTLDRVFRLRVELHGFYPDVDNRVEETFELNLDETEELLAITNRTWIRLLSDLVSRTSDLAYLTVHSRLEQQWGEYFAQEDEEQWSDLWRSKIARSAATLFRNHLLDPQTGECADAMHRDAESFLVKLPCNHLLRTTMKEMAEVTADVAQTAACVEDCRRRIMQESDDAALALRRQHAERVEAELRDEAWNELDNEELDRFMYTIPMYLLGRVLREAGRSLDVPKSIAPIELSLLHCEETNLALQVLESWAAAQNDVIHASSARLVHQLREIVNTALAETATPGLPFTPTPSEWATFLDALLKRAINFLAHRGCNDGSDEHEGLHFHDSMFFYNCLEVEARLMLGAGVSEEATAKKLKDMMEGNEDIMKDLGADGTDDVGAGYEWEDVDLRSDRARAKRRQLE